jgi:hypothetical protein
MPPVLPARRPKPYKDNPARSEDIYGRSWTAFCTSDLGETWDPKWFSVTSGLPCSTVAVLLTATTRLLYGAGCGRLVVTLAILAREDFDICPESS